VKKIDFTIEKANLYEKIVDGLEKVIMESESDEKLPSESALAKQFDVSKAVIREALKVLKDRGLIQSRNGDGSYITRPDTSSVADAVSRIIKMKNNSDENIHNLRLILETATVKAATLHARAEDIKQLEENLKIMSELVLLKNRRIETEIQRVETDIQFHLMLARAGENPLLTIFVEVLMILLKDYMIKASTSKYYDRKNNIAEHREIIEAVKKREVEYAEKAMLNHLFAARKNVDTSRSTGGKKQRAQ
jgi:GntR family transcriptional repressor for pyruvate dehydrogenase complex